LPIKKSIKFELVFVPAEIHDYDDEEKDFNKKVMPLMTFPLPDKCNLL